MYKKIVIVIITFLCFLLLKQNESIYANTNLFPGTGTKEDPFQISSSDDLFLLAQSVNNGNAFLDQYFVQTCDINLDNKEWTPIGEFNTENSFDGVYDGNGHYVENLNIISDGNVGFFGQLGGTIMNFGIESGNISGACVGSISSHSSNSTAQIINCYSKANVTAYRAGGIADNFNGSIINCWSMCNLTATPEGDVGGIVSYDATTIINCVSISSEPKMEKTYSDEIIVLSKTELSPSEFASMMNKNIINSASMADINFKDFNLITAQENDNIRYSINKMSLSLEYLPSYISVNFFRLLPLLFFGIYICFINIYINRKQLLIGETHE